MKKFAVITLIFLAAGCGHKPSNMVGSQSGSTNSSASSGYPQINVINNPYVTPAEISPTPADDNWNREAQKRVKELINETRTGNELFLKGPTGDYSGLPLPKENDKTISTDLSARFYEDSCKVGTSFRRYKSVIIRQQDIKITIKFCSCPNCCSELPHGSRTLKVLWQ